MAQRSKLAHDDIEAIPAARRLAGSAVDHEVCGTLGDLGVQVVVQHAQGGFLDPPFAGELGAAGGADHAGRGHLWASLPQLALS